MSREYKKYGIRPSRKPMMNPYVASTVQVVDERGKAGYCYIGFDEPLVEVVGKKMPRGVSTFNPAFLSVVYDLIKKAWVVTSTYVLDEKTVILWESVEKPTWLKFISYEVTHGTSVTQAKSRTRPRTSGADYPSSAGSAYA